MIKKRSRSASIAAPGSGLCPNSDEGSGPREEDDEEEGTLASSTLMRCRSERRYHSSGNPCHWTASDLEDLSTDSWHKYYQRCFSVTSSGGIVNRGDCLRYRRVRSLSLFVHQSPEEASTKSSGTPNLLRVPSATSLWKPAAVASTSSSTSIQLPDLDADEEFVVYLVGLTGVGKTALTQQFTTSEHILSSDKTESKDNPSVIVCLDGKESRLAFKEFTSISALVDHPKDNFRPDAFIVVYSVTEVDSFLSAGYALDQLRQLQLTKDSAVVILVGNKSDLVRSRAIRVEEGQTLAGTYKVKFIETSVAIHYNVDELLVAVLSNLRVLMQRRRRASQSPRWDGFSRARSSIRRIVGRVFKKESRSTVKWDM